MCTMLGTEATVKLTTENIARKQAWQAAALVMTRTDIHAVLPLGRPRTGSMCRSAGG